MPIILEAMNDHEINELRSIMEALGIAAIDEKSMKLHIRTPCSDFGVSFKNDPKLAKNNFREIVQAISENMEEIMLRINSINEQIKDEMEIRGEFAYIGESLMPKEFNTVEEWKLACLKAKNA